MAARIKLPVQRKSLDGPFCPEVSKNKAQQRALSELVPFRSQTMHEMGRQVLTQFVRGPRSGFQYGRNGPGQIRQLSLFQPAGRADLLETGPIRFADKPDGKRTVF